MNRFEVSIEYGFDVETNSVIATVPDLNYISSFGKDFAEAEKNVTEAVLAYLEALKMDGLPALGQDIEITVSPKSETVSSGKIKVFC